MIIFSERLRLSRERKSLTQEDIAAAIGMSRPGYTKIEQGQREPSLEKLIRISEALDVTVDYLLGFDRGQEIIKREVTSVDDLEIEVIVRRKKSPIPCQED